MKEKLITLKSVSRKGLKITPIMTTATTMTPRSITDFEIVVVIIRIIRFLAGSRLIDFVYRSITT